MRHRGEGNMRARISWPPGLLTILALILVPASVCGQANVPPEEPPWPLPVFNTHPEMGGLYIAGEGLLYSMDNPLKLQPIAIKGFTDTKGDISGIPGTFVGNGQSALTDESGMRHDLTTGFNFVIGYKFSNDTAIEVDWMHLLQTGFCWSTPAAPYNIVNTPAFAQAYMSSPVVNLPVGYAGPPQKVPSGLGLLNLRHLECCCGHAHQLPAAIRQGRSPVSPTDHSERRLPLVWHPGRRMVYLRERFDWVTVDADLNGNSTSNDVGLYTNKVSNLMFGPKLGWGNEYYMGHGFALTIDLEGALMFDLVNEYACYSLDNPCAGARIRYSNGRRTRRCRNWKRSSTSGGTPTKAFRCALATMPICSSIRLRLGGPLLSTSTISIRTTHTAFASCKASTSASGSFSEIVSPSTVTPPNAYLPKRGQAPRRLGASPRIF